MPFVFIVQRKFCLLSLLYNTHNTNTIQIMSFVFIVQHTQHKRPNVYSGKRSWPQGALCSVLLTKYYWGANIKKTKIGRACSTYGEEERFIQGFSGET